MNLTQTFGVNLTSACVAIDEGIKCMENVFAAGCGAVFPAGGQERMKQSFETTEAIFYCDSDGGSAVMPSCDYKFCATNYLTATLASASSTDHNQQCTGVQSAIDCHSNLSMCNEIQPAVEAAKASLMTMYSEMWCNGAPGYGTDSYYTDST